MEFEWENLITKETYLSEKPMIIHQGGTWSGKTIGILMAIVLWTSESKAGLTASVVAPSYPHLRRGAVKDFKDIMIDAGFWKRKYWNASTLTYKIGRSTIEFASIDSEAKAKSGKRDILFLNESIDIDYTIARHLINRTRLRTVIDYNPAFEFWAHEHYIGSTKTDFFRSTYIHNPKIPEHIREVIESYKETDKEYYKVYALGKTGSLSGRVFSNFRFVDSFPENCKWVCYGVDYGYTHDPTTLIKVGYAKGEIWVQELHHQTGVSIEKMERLFFENGLKKGLDEIVPDPSEKLGNDELAKKGWRIINLNSDIKYGIDLMKRRRINITQDSKFTKKEFRNYRYVKDREGNFINIPEDKMNHTIDPIRYVHLHKFAHEMETGRYSAHM